MADSEQVILGPKDPQLDDLEMVIVNVQTRDGAQFSMVYEVEPGTCLSLVVDDVTDEENEHERSFRVRKVVTDAVES